MTPTFQPKRKKATPMSAKHTMLNNPCRNLSGHSVKQLAFVEKRESCDHPNNQRAMMSNTMINPSADAVAAP